jgi:hypothetical protein
LGIKIVNSIDAAQSKAEKQRRPPPRSLHTTIKAKIHVDERKGLFEELGVNSQQFKTLFDNLPQGVALYKMVYNPKGDPVDFILLENKK